MRYPTTSRLVLGRSAALAVVLASGAACAQVPSRSPFCDAVPYCLSHDAICVVHQKRAAGTSEAYEDMLNVVSQQQQAGVDLKYVEVPHNLAQYFQGLNAKVARRTLFVSRSGRSIAFSGEFTDDLKPVRDYFTGSPLPADYGATASEQTLTLRPGACQAGNP